MKDATDWLRGTCTVGEIQPYDDGRFAGGSVLLSACPQSSQLLVVVVSSPDVDFAVQLQVMTTSASDIAAVGRILRTLTVPAG